MVHIVHLQHETILFVSEKTICDSGDCSPPQHCRTAGVEAGLVHLYGPLCAAGANRLEPGPHSHLPALHQGRGLA